MKKFWPFLLILGLLLLPRQARAQSGDLTTISFGPVLPLQCRTMGTSPFAKLFYLTTVEGSNAVGFYYCAAPDVWLMAGAVGSSGISSGSTTPSSCSINGELFINTTNSVLYVCSDGSYVSLGNVTIVTSPPSTCTAGDFYFDTTNGILYIGNSNGTCSTYAGASSSSGVSSFSSGNLSPLFTASVATPTTTPALSFSLSNAAADSWFGNATGSPAPPAFNTSAIPVSIGGTGAATAPGDSWFGNATGSTAAPLFNTSVIPVPLIPNPAGDVTGTYAATTVVGLHFGTNGYALSTSALTANDCIGYNGTVILGVNCGSGSMIYPSGTGIPQVSSGTSWGTTLGVQGTDANVPTSGTVASGAGNPICTDANGGLTTSGCPSGGLSSAAVVGDGVIDQPTTSTPSPCTGPSCTFNLTVASYPLGWFVRTGTPVGSTPVAFMNVTHCITSGTGPYTAICTIPVTAGEELVVGCVPYDDGGCQSMGFSDSLRNSWTSPAGANTTAYAAATSSGSDTITVTSSSGPDPVYVVALANVQGFDVAANYRGCCSAPNGASTTLSTSAAQDVIVDFGNLGNSGGLSCAYPYNSTVTGFDVGVVDQYQDSIHAHSTCYSFAALSGTVGSGSYTTSDGSPAASYAWMISLAFKPNSSTGTSPLTVGPVSQQPGGLTGAAQTQFICNMATSPITSSSTANTAVTLISCPVTIPSTGGQYAALASYEVYCNENAGQYAWDTWVSDGTSGKEFAGFEAHGASGNNGAAQMADMSKQSYTSGASVTFYLQLASPQASGATCQSTPQSSADPLSSYLKITLFPAAY